MHCVAGLTGMEEGTVVTFSGTGAGGGGGVGC